MDHAGVETVDEVRLAGAFGSQIDTFHAMVLGLIPDCDLGHVKSAGNAAGTGALIALLSRRGPARDRGGRPAGREDRDRGRAALPGALRRRDGVPAPDGAVSRTWRRSSTLPAARASRRRRRRTSAGPRRRRRRRAVAAADGGGPMTIDDSPRRGRGGRAGRTAARLRSPRRARAVPDPHARAVRGPRRGGPGDSSSRTPTRSSRRSGSSSAATRTRSRLLRDAGADVQGERVRFPRGHVPPDRPGDRAARSSPSTPATPRNSVQIGGDRTPSSPRTTARRSSATSTTAGATARSRTSATS